MQRGRLYPQTKHRGLMPDVREWYYAPRQALLRITWFPSQYPFGAALASLDGEPKVDGLRLVYNFTPSQIWYPGTTIQFISDGTNDLALRGCHVIVSYPNGKGQDFFAPWTDDVSSFLPDGPGVFEQDNFDPSLGQFVETPHYAPVDWNDFPRDKGEW